MCPKQQGGQSPGAMYPGASTLDKYAGPFTGSAAAATRSQPYNPQGYQRPAENSDETSMLYGVFRQHRTSVADSYAEHDGHAAASAAQVQSHITAEHHHNNQQQQRMLLPQCQQEAAAAQAKQQQLLRAQAQQAQRQQQAALARSAAAAAAAGLAGSRALYGNYQSMSAEQQQQWNCNVGDYSHQQQPFGLSLQHTGLPPRPANHHASSSAWSNTYVAAAADAAKSACLALRQLQNQNSDCPCSSVLASRYAQQASGAAAAQVTGARKGPVARWSGQLGIINAPGAVPGSAESDANTGGFLECNEDLLSLEALDVCNQQPVPAHESAAAAVQPSTHPRILQQATKTRCVFGPESLPGYAQDTSVPKHSDSDDTMSDDDMEDDQFHAINRRADPAAVGSSVLVSAGAAAVAAEEALASEHSVVLQVLGIAAERRKGAPVLTAAPVHAAAAGAQSVRPRLLISEVSVYTENGANSQLALEQANKLLGKMTLPDDIDYMPVSSESFLYRAGAAWQFPAFVVCLGSSYLQRMFARLPQLAAAAWTTPGFEDYCQYMVDTYQGTIPRRLSGEAATSTLATLRSVQFTCLFLALKMADQIHAVGLLRFMLTNLSHNGAVVSLQQASDVEARCVDALGWRLGPFFIEDDLSGNDELLWAEAMGHWDYGTDRDSYPVACE